MIAQQTVSLRHATAADEPVLRDLASLDSTRLSDGPYLVAEADGRILAALSLTDGTAIADPFEPTAQLVELLRAHGAARAADARRRRTRPRLTRRALRPAFISS